MRYWTILCAGCFTALLAGCSSPATPTPTPDDFRGVAQQAQADYQQGVELEHQGQIQAALAAFRQAQLLSPADDPSIDASVQRLAAELTPTATPAPATPTPQPQPTPVVESSATPAADLGNAYFGQVELTIVPGQNNLPPPMTQFSAQDQVGLYIQNLDQRLHLDFRLRIFDADSGQVLVDASADTLQKFQNNFVWYHQGGEALGNYHAELYAGDVLTQTFDYAVGNVPVAVPTDTPVPTPVPASASQPVAAAPTTIPAPASQPVPPPQQPTGNPQPAAQPASAPQPPTGNPQPAAQPVPAPQPQPTLSATLISVAGGPLGMDVLAASDQLYVADRSGLVWVLDHGQPMLKRPFSVSGEPVALAADPDGGRLYIAVRSQPRLLITDASSGQQLASIPLAGDPDAMRLDSGPGLLFINIPDQATLETVDVRAAKVVRSTPGLAQVTGLAVDAETHTLYASQLDGMLTAIDEQTGQITRRMQLSDVGLAGLDTSGGRIFAINTPGQQLISVDPATGDISQFALGAQPAALVMGPQSGTAYVLEAPDNNVVRLDPGTGSELGRVSLGDAGIDAPSLDPDQLWLRPRMVVSASDEAVDVTEPDGGTLALLPPAD